MVLFMFSQKPRALDILLVHSLYQCQLVFFVIETIPSRRKLDSSFSCTNKGGLVTVRNRLLQLFKCSIKEVLLYSFFPHSNCAHCQRLCRRNHCNPPVSHDKLKTGWKWATVLLYQLRSQIQWITLGQPNSLLNPPGWRCTCITSYSTRMLRVTSSDCRSWVRQSMDKKATLPRPGHHGHFQKTKADDIISTQGTDPFTR